MISPLVFPTFPFLRQLPQALYRYLLFCLYQLLLRFRNLVFAELLFLTRIFITFFILIFTVTRWFCRLKTIVILNSKRKWLSISKIYWEVSLSLYASNFFLLFFTQKQRPILSYFYIRNEIYFTDFIAILSLICLFSS